MLQPPPVIAGRKAAERTRDALWDKIGEVLGAFSAQECTNYFRHAGYAPT